MQELRELYQLIVEGRASRMEEKRFFDLLIQPGNEDVAREMMHDYALRSEKDASIVPIEPERLKIIGESVLMAEDAEQHAPQRIVAGHRVHFLKTAWFRYAAAIIILFGIGAYLWNTEKEEKALITDTKPVPVKNDVAPGRNLAVLTLSNGQKVELTPAMGSIEDKGITIKNLDGRLEYGKAMQVVHNTMSTPRGGQYQLTLPDGTNVWLNAASSITYPTAFVSDTREVSITGEAYFEVKKNLSKPFIVKTQKQDILVLGTKFNVNAYFDENAMTTSLLEGSIKIGARVLQPGQAYVDGRIKQTNIEQDVAWKNGVFDFSGTSLSTAMKQLARWYDVEVKFSGDVPAIQLGGKIGRSLTLQQVLNGLEDAELDFELSGKTLTVSRQ